MSSGMTVGDLANMIQPGETVRLKVGGQTFRVTRWRDIEDEEVTDDEGGSVGSGDG